MNWPERSNSRLIPSAANSIVIKLTRPDDTSIAGQRLERPAVGGSTTATFDNLPAGEIIVRAHALPNANGTGTFQATATAPVTIESGKTSTLSLTLESTIDRLEVTPSPLSLTVGQVVDLVVTAKNSFGSVVLTDPTKISFTRKNSSAPEAFPATVDSTGKVTAHILGTIDIVVTETESGKQSVVPVAVVPPASPIAQQCVAFQMDKGHTGNAVFGQPLTFPDKPTWSVPLERYVSYPLIVEGRVFVMTWESGKPIKLYGFDKSTGSQLWEPIELKSSLYPFYFGGLTYENGKVFTLTDAGFFQAFDAATGKLHWTLKLTGQSFWTKPPVISNGILFTGGVGSGSTLYAVDANTGTLIWQDNIFGGAYESPAVSSDGTILYANDRCTINAVSAQRTSSRQYIWGNGNSPCGSILGAMPVYSDGLLYVADSTRNNIYDGKTGAIRSTFTAATTPAIRDGIGYLMRRDSKGALMFHGVTLATDSARWTIDASQFISNPLIIDDTVFIGTKTGGVYALDAATGARKWSGVAGTEMYSSVATFVTGMGAGEGYLVVPTVGRLTAWHLAGPK